MMRHSHLVPVILILSSTLPACSTTETLPEPARSAAKRVGYVLVKKDDISVGSRTRYTIHILAPLALTIDERAGVAMKAAVDCQEQTDAKMVEVFLDISRQTSGAVLPYAIARYAPDGRGMSGLEHYTWEVKATGESIPSIQVDVADLWFANWDKPQFQLRNGLTDERKMHSFIANELKVKPSEVRLPAVLVKDYYTR